MTNVFDNAELLFGQAGIPGTGVTNGEKLTINSRLTDLENAPALPVGGTTGQVLRKNSNADADAGWHTFVMADVSGLNAALLDKQTRLEGFNEDIGQYQLLSNQITPINGIKGWKNPSGDQFYLEPKYGTGADQIARGNHRHTTVTLLTMTHKVNTSTTPRTSPGTSGWAYSSLGLNVEVASLGSQTFTSDGANWRQCLVPNVGVVWINNGHLTAL